MTPFKPVIFMIVLVGSAAFMLSDPPTLQASGFSSSIGGGGFTSRSGASRGSMSGVTSLGSGSSDSSQHRKAAGLMYEHERQEIERQREEERRNRGRGRAPDPPPRLPSAPATPSGPAAAPLPAGN
ncbi:MAG: hypothetical protein PVJ53_14445 [Desulfobacterales bacterium]